MPFSNCALCRSCGVNIEPPPTEAPAFDSLHKKMRESYDAFVIFGHRAGVRDNGGFYSRELLDKISQAFPSGFCSPIQERTVVRQVEGYVWFEEECSMAVKNPHWEENSTCRTELDKIRVAQEKISASQIKMIYDGAMQAIFSTQQQSAEASLHLEKDNIREQTFVIREKEQAMKKKIESAQSRPNTDSPTL